MQNLHFYCQHLKKAKAPARRLLAQKVVNDQLDLLGMAIICLPSKELRLQYLWMLSEVGELNPKVLEAVTDEIYELVLKFEIPNIGASFSNYWLHCTLNDKQVSRYWSVLLEWATSPNETITTKKRAQKVIGRLAERFPELKAEMNLRLGMNG